MKIDEQNQLVMRQSVTIFAKWYAVKVTRNFHYLICLMDMALARIIIYLDYARVLIILAPDCRLSSVINYTPITKFHNYTLVSEFSLLHSKKNNVPIKLCVGSKPLIFLVRSHWFWVDFNRTSSNRVSNLRLYKQ